MLKPNRKRRKLRIRSKISGDAKRPRVSIFKSNMHISAQIIDDVKGVTLVSFSDVSLKREKANKTQIAEMVGENLAELALKSKIKSVVFDRSGYRYHGRVKALAEGLRKKGIEL